MAYKIMKYSGHYVAGHNEYVCDTADDVALLPTDESVPFGSTAHIIGSNATVEFNSNGEWVILNNATGSALSAQISAKSAKEDAASAAENAEVAQTAADSVTVATVEEILDYIKEVT